jgi:hypothetical protein
MNTENNELLGLITEELFRIKTMLKSNSATVSLAIGDLEACISGLRNIYNDSTEVPEEDSVITARYEPQESPETEEVST